MAVGGNRVDIKVVMLGKEYAGKTAIFERFLHDHFIGDFQYQSTIGASYGGKRMVADTGEALVLGVWDTAGSERYESMSRLYYRDAKAAVVCYDVTDISSFERAKFWVRELRNLEPLCRVYLTACKCDLAAESGVVSMDDVKLYAESVKATQFQTSALTGENIVLVFQTITDDMVKDRNLRRNGDIILRDEMTHSDVKRLQDPSVKKKCCS